MWKNSITLGIIDCNRQNTHFCIIWMVGLGSLLVRIELERSQWVDRLVNGSTELSAKTYFYGVNGDRWNTFILNCQMISQLQTSISRNVVARKTALYLTSLTSWRQNKDFFHELGEWPHSSQLTIWTIFLVWLCGNSNYTFGSRINSPSPGIKWSIVLN